MSEKTPISLHNSDLFLKPEFTEPNKEQLNLDTFKNSILKKGPSLGENNHIKPLYTSDLLPRFYNAYFNKTVTSYTDFSISTKLKVRNQRLESASQRYRSKIDNLKHETSKRQGKFSLKYELRSGFIPYDKVQLESQNKYYVRSKSRFAENAERLISNHTSQNYSEASLSLRPSEHTSALLNLEVVNPVQTKNKAKLSYPVLYKNEVIKKNEGARVLLNLPSIIRSGISKEFLLVAINLILLSVLAVIQRNKYGKGFSPIISRGSHTLLYASKIPNISSSLQNKVLDSANKQSSWQYFNQIKPGYLSFVLQHKIFTVPWQDQKQEKFVGVFLGEANFSSGVVNDEENLLSVLPPAVDCVIKPWYCMKAYNTSNDKIVATRSVQKKVNNSTFYKNPKIQGFEYYMPYYTSQERVFAESDTIPSKRGSTSSKTVKKSNLLPNYSRSSTTTSQFLLKRFFYKYGLFVVSPEVRSGESQKKRNSFQISKEERNYLTRSPYINNQSLRGLIEIKNQTINQIHDQEEAFTQTQSNFRTISQKIEVNLKSSCIPGDHINLALYKNFDTSKKVIFPLTFAWSKYDLSKVNPNAFAQVKSSISIFNFIPDNLVKNTSVSGYKFPELKKKEIVYLFRQRAILYFYLYLNTEKKVFDKAYIKTPLLNQITAPFHTFQSSDLIDQVLSAQKNEFLNEVFTKSNNKNGVNVSNLASKDFGMSPNLSMSFCEDIDLKMQYTQVNLDEIENVKEIFSQMGRDYEEYLRQPKDSLPALIISPSLEDDREIEEEGIQIFRKRDLIKNTKNTINTSGELGESKTFSENVFKEKNFNGELHFNDTSVSTTQELNKSAESKSEIQNRQILVKNALRQAQEEIDNIAKKEEKGSDKEKQVIPPLTRLEALYTIRNREKKHEQAKDLRSSKNTPSYLRLRASKNPFNLLSGFGLSKKKARFNDFVSQSKSTLPESTSSLPFRGANELPLRALNGKGFKRKGLPLFEELFLYSDKSSAGLKSASKLFNHICTDRKHSFFGEMSLLPKKLTAQEQKQIFQQKANPLLKVNMKNMQEENNILSLSSLKVFNFEQQKIVDLDITQSPKFQIGTRLLPETMSGLQGKALFKSLLCRSEVPTPTYFYNNLSQNKACQASTPKIKDTPLGSPVYHRVWQPKRMEPSTFRVSSRSQSTPVLPIITQKDWKNIINWQLKKYFFEEDRRLLSLFAKQTSEVPYRFKREAEVRGLNKNKNLKIKKVNLYLPWISIKRAENIVNNQGLQSFVVTNQENNVVKPVQMGTICNELRSFASRKDKAPLASSNSTQLHRKTSNYWRLPVQQTLSTITWPVKKQERQSQKEELGRVNKSQIKIPQKELGVGKKVCNESILFESVTTYSWLFVYTFVFVLMFKQLFNFVYKVGFKDFFIKFLNSDFGRTITSEEFRYSIQNLPLTDSYMPKKRLQELLGLEKNKMQLLEVVWFLRNNCQGRNGPRGILLVGPPGVENVSVVQAIAGEAKVPIIVQSLEKIAQDNEPQRQLEQLYMRAHKKAPCVLFLDQLDTIGARRDQLFTNKRDAHSLGSSMNSISNKKDYNINTGVQNFVNSGNKLNVVLRLLTILDGITQSSGVVTVATAQDLTKLDPALLRPKRFDRRIYLSLPNQQDRVHLFKIQTQSIGHVKEIPWDYLSLQTENMSTADIKSAINYSLFRAVLRNSAHTVETLEYGIDCVKSLTNKRVDKK